MSAAKVLLMDTNVASLPIFDYLVERGYDVFVMGQNTSDYLARANRNFINADYSNYQVLEDATTFHEFDFVVPGCNDCSYLMAARISEKFGFYGIENREITDIINEKDKFRSLALKLGIPVPKTYPTAADVKFECPVIVKPIDAYSGRGISIVNKEGQMKGAIENAKRFSKSKKVILEEFVRGQLFSHSAFLVNKKILCDFIVEEHGTANPFVVDSSFVVNSFQSNTLQAIRKEVEKLASHLKLKDGLLHTQFILNGNQFWLLEVTKRCPGDLYSKLIQYSTGVPYAELYTLPFLGQPFREIVHIKNPIKVIRHTVSSRDEFFYQSFKVSKKLKVKELIPLTLPGSRLKPSPFDRVALLFIECDGQSEFSELWQATLSRELYTFS